MLAMSRISVRGVLKANKTGNSSCSGAGAASRSTFHLSIISHATAIAVGAVAATACLTIYSADPRSLADYISAICAKPFGSSSAAEAPYLAENVGAMTKMMIDMGIRPRAMSMPTLWR